MTSLESSEDVLALFGDLAVDSAEFLDLRIGLLHDVGFFGLEFATIFNLFLDEGTNQCRCAALTPFWQAARSFASSEPSKRSAHLERLTLVTGACLQEVMIPTEFRKRRLQRFFGLGYEFLHHD